MAFRPNNNLIEGVLDNTTPGQVVGWIDFYRQAKEPLHCTLELDGDFHDDIRGRILHFWNDNPSDAGYDGSLGRIEPEYMDSMYINQIGKTGDITFESKKSVYIEWYSDRNGRVALAVPSDKTEILGAEIDISTLPPRKSHPEAFAGFTRKLAVAFRKHSKNPNASLFIIGKNGIINTDESEKN